jgi:hypothetical protein
LEDCIVTKTGKKTGEKRERPDVAKMKGKKPDLNYLADSINTRERLTKTDVLKVAWEQGEELILARATCKFRKIRFNKWLANNITEFGRARAYHYIAYADWYACLVTRRGEEPKLEVMWEKWQKISGNTSKGKDGQGKDGGTGDGGGGTGTGTGGGQGDGGTEDGEGQGESFSQDDGQGGRGQGQGQGGGSSGGTGGSGGGSIGGGGGHRQTQSEKQTGTGRSQGEEDQGRDQEQDRDQERSESRVVSVVFDGEEFLKLTRSESYMMKHLACDDRSEMLKVAYFMLLQMSREADGLEDDDDGGSKERSESRVVSVVFDGQEFLKLTRSESYMMKHLACDDRSEPPPGDLRLLRLLHDLLHPLPFGLLHDRVGLASFPPILDLVEHLFDRVHEEGGLDAEQHHGKYGGHFVIRGGSLPAADGLVEPGVGRHGPAPADVILTGPRPGARGA